MAFGKRGENVPEKINLMGKVIAPTVIIQKQNEQFSRKIEIKKDGNYINNKLCSLEEIAKTGKEWYKTSNDWILLLVDESIPFNRIDEVREALANAKVYHVTQSKVNSDDVVYFIGDVSELAKLKQGKFDDWFSSQLKNSPEIRSNGKDTIETIPAKDGYPAIKAKMRRIVFSYSFIIGKDGKVRDAHIVKGSGYPEADAAFEKILSQIPDWIPAKRDRATVSVYNYENGGLFTTTP
jgi:hypothetical protein